MSGKHRREAEINDRMLSPVRDSFHLSVWIMYGRFAQICFQAEAYIRQEEQADLRALQEDSWKS